MYFDFFLTVLSNTSNSKTLALQLRLHELLELLEVCEARLDDVGGQQGLAAWRQRRALHARLLFDRLRRRHLRLELMANHLGSG